VRGERECSTGAKGRSVSERRRLGSNNNIDNKHNISYESTQLSVQRWDRWERVRAERSSGWGGGLSSSA